MTKMPTFERCVREIHQHRDVDKLLVVLTQQVSTTCTKEVQSTLPGAKVFFLANRVVEVRKDIYDSAEEIIHAINDGYEVVIITHEEIE